MGRICKKCGCEFKSAVKIDGRWRSATKRLFCFECSPFGAHNTRDLTHISTENGTHKTCGLCGESKVLTDFYSAKRKSGNIRSFSYCIACERERQFNNTQAFKLKCLEYKNSMECQHCGYSKYIGAREFHHLDRTTKNESINQLKRNKNWKMVAEELEKCIVLCANCHREAHARKVGAG